MKRILAITAIALAASAGMFVGLKNRGDSSNSLLTGPQGARIQKAYQEWKVKNRRLYGTPAESSFRKTVFAKNFIKIDDVNNKNLNYKFALNQFSDLTAEEIKAQYFGLGNPKDLKLTTSRRRLEEDSETIKGLGQLASHKDWETDSDLGEVVHQGGCGSCYSFATVISLEHQYYKKNGKRVDISKQELVDCSKGFGNSGCRGGWMHQAYDYVLQNGGLQLSSSYPYFSAEGSTCKQNSAKNVKGLLSSYVRIDEHDNHHIMRALEHAVVPSAVDASDLSFYSSGVYDNKECRSDINHAIVIVGYGQDANGTKYWKIRNSWGNYWGENGYFKLLRHEGRAEGICGITQYNVYPVA